MRLHGKVAIVTGAGSGNGKAIAEGFAREGARVVAADLLEESASATVRDIEKVGGAAKGIRIDVRNAADAQRMTDFALSAFGRLDVLVNNAGVISRSDFLELDEQEFDRIFAVNVKGVFLCAQAAARHMARHGGGNIINISSAIAESFDPVIVHYSASKGAVRSLTGAMALALARRGIRVNAIAPGPIYTNMNRDKLDVPENMAAVVAHVPLGRIGKTEDLVGAALFLAADESAWVTGTTIYVDGGYLTM